MESLYFDDLCESQLVYFQGVPGTSKFPRIGGYCGCSTLDRAGEEVRKHIDYRFPTGRMAGSPQAYRWRMMRLREYGPA